MRGDSSKWTPSCTEDLCCVGRDWLLAVDGTSKGTSRAGLEPATSRAGVWRALRSTLLAKFLNEAAIP